MFEAEKELDILEEYVRYWVDAMVNAKLLVSESIEAYRRYGVSIMCAEIYSRVMTFEEFKDSVGFKRLVLSPRKK